MTVHKFLSPEWLLEIESALRARFTREMLNYMSTSVLTVFTDCPDADEKALFASIEGGALGDISLKEKPYPAAEFIIQGNYDVFKQVMSGELDPMKALMTGELKFTGNLIRALQMTSLLQPFYQVLADVPCEF